jgi:hypothetical protein
MAVLLSYNEADSWTVANLVKATQITEDLLAKASPQQCCGAGMISSRIQLNFILDPGSYYKRKKSKF